MSDNCIAIPSTVGTIASLGVAYHFHTKIAKVIDKYANHNALLEATPNLYLRMVGESEDTVDAAIVAKKAEYVKWEKAELKDIRKNRTLALIGAGVLASIAAWNYFDVTAKLKKLFD